MAIARPVTKTIISTTAFGIPVVDAVNANTTDIAAMKPSAWTAVTFQNNWSNLAAGFESAAYRKIGDLVYLRGMIKGGTMGAVAFNLPVGFRPLLNFQCVTVAEGAFAYLNVLADGRVMPVIGNPASFSLNVPPISTI